MKVMFGMSLDGYEPPEQENTIGVFVTGPNGLLELLETRLGLGGQWSAQPLRVVQYQRCLNEAADETMFYSKSISVDGLAVADVLLGWRDEWVAAGWDGTAEISDSKRLRDMAKVEVLARERLSMGVADRLQAVIKALNDRQPAIDEVRVIDPLHDLPPAWQKVLGGLPVAQAAVDEWGGVAEEKGTDLAALQRAMLTGNRASYHGDGSFFAIESDSEHTLSRALGESFAKFDAWGSGCTTIIAGRRGAVLDEGLQSVNLPISGRADASQWRPAAQVLRLALSLLWNPLDPHRLLEFLTHPVCPVRQPMRLRLASVVASTPGVGGLDWDRVIDEARADVVAKTNGKPGAGEVVDELVRTWLVLPRFDPANGAPTTVLGEHAALVARWAAAQANNQNIEGAQRSSFLAAQKQANSAAEAIDEIARGGVDVLPRLQLERLLDQVTALGAVRPDLGAECGHIHVIRDAAAAIRPVDRIVWWDFSSPDLPRKWAWTPDEIVQLRKHGADLPSIDTMLQFAAKSWLRPVMAATRQLVLFMPRRRGHKEFAHHPLLDQILALAKDGQIPTLDLDWALDEGEIPPWISVGGRIVEHQGLPRQRRWWGLADGELLGKRELESYSSLNSFVHVPHQWVLRYKARLFPGSLAKIPEGNRQKGSLLHRLFEWLFTSSKIDWRATSQTSLQRWIGRYLPILLEQEGANYLLPGKAREAEDLRTVAVDAAWALIRHLRAARIDSVRMEKYVEGTYPGGRLGGRIDMLVSGPEKHEAVLDLKWRGFKYRCAEMRENQQLQLAVYAVMRRQSTRRWPSQAYFILEDSRMVAQDNHYFSRATVCAPAGEYANTAALWAGFEESWIWRRKQLDQGIIEVNVAGTEPDEHSIPPEGGLPIAEANVRFDDYIALTGWPEGA